MENLKPTKCNSWTKARKAFFRLQTTRTLTTHSLGKTACKSNLLSSSSRKFLCQIWQRNRNKRRPHHQNLGVSGRALRLASLGKRIYNRSVYRTSFWKTKMLERIMITSLVTTMRKPFTGSRQARHPRTMRKERCPVQVKTPWKIPSRSKDHITSISRFTPLTSYIKRSPLRQFSYRMYQRTLRVCCCSIQYWRARCRTKTWKTLLQRSVTNLGHLSQPVWCFCCSSFRWLLTRNRKVFSLYAKSSWRFF